MGMLPDLPDSKTLVPSSLSLVAQKEKKLQLEATQLDQLLGERHETLCVLRDRHEHLLTTNGRLQERRRGHWEKLVALRAQLGDARPAAGDSRKGDALTSDVIGGKELEATADKCRVLTDVLRALAEKYTGLERQCMGLKEQSTRESAALAVKTEHLNEARSTLCLMLEDTHSTIWNLEYDQVELAEANRYLDGVSQRAQHEAATIEKMDRALTTEKAAVDDLQISWQTYEGMANEEHRQFLISNADATSEQRELQKLFESNGPTCPADEEVLQLAKELQTRLQHVNDEVANTKFYKRELALRRKQEKEWLVFTQSSIKAKDEQLTWLERQRKHLENELKEAEKTRDANEADYQAFLYEYNTAVALHDSQLQDAEKQLKATERAICAGNKRVAAANKKIAQKTKVLAESQTKLSAKQEELKKSTATQTLVDAEVLALQSALEQVLRNVERTQQLRATRVMESEKLRSSCAKLESEIQDTHQELAVLTDNVAAAQTAVKNHTDEVRDKFLGTFVTDDAGSLIELLNKEIASRAISGTNRADDDTIACQTDMLKQKYKEASATARRKFGTILRQKEKQYNAMVAKSAGASTACNMHRTDREMLAKESACANPTPALCATGHDPAADSSMEMSTPVNGCEDNEIEVQQTGPPNVERLSNAATANKDTGAEKCLIKPRKQKTKGVQKLVPKSARRQLAPGLSSADESPQTDNELTEVFTTDAGVIVRVNEATKDGQSTFSRQRKRSDTREPRLKRRTPAQKAGKPAQIASITPTALIASVTASDASTTSSAQPGLAADMASQDSLESQIRSEDDRETSQPVLATQDSNTAALPVQVTVNKTQVLKASSHSKNTSKSRTTTKPSHRSRQLKTKKVSRISLGRSQISGSIADWSAADTFSFD
uniref:Uncharacterized protein n=1 Tax=Peronospora matthiolae TaxID=2874970 RepID=A0AAV1T7A4_9STRA